MMKGHTNKSRRLSPDSLDSPPSYTPRDFLRLWGQRLVILLSATVVFALAFATKGCNTMRGAGARPGAGFTGRHVKMEITAYDNGQKSCNWKYDAKGNPVIASGPDAGKPKVVGQTASGRMTAPGTIAADTKYYPFGTRIYVPGYGMGTVWDRGGDIKGPHRLDLWFPTEREALIWGRQKNVRVIVWKPAK